jgi:ketosteroid isomerase-like protein
MPFTFNTGVLTGTHTGPLAGFGEEVVAPTNQSIRIPICLVIQFEDGQAVQVYEYNDQLGLLNQLGLTT